jgi:aminopeptidase N
MRIRRALFLLLFLALAHPTAADEAFRQAPDEPVAVDHIALDLDVDVRGRSVRGTATLEVHAVRDVPAVQLDGVALAVSSILATRLGGPLSSAAPVSFENDGRALSLRLPLKRDERARIIVAYSVEDPKSGLWFHGPTKAEPDVPLQVWSQGEASENRYWFPCVDHPSIRQTSEVTVRVPAGFLALSNGALVSETRDDARGISTFHWVQAKSHVSYLITLVVGKFHVARAEWRGKPVLYYVPEAHADEVARTFGHTTRMLDFFSDKIGVEFPWEKYAQVCVEQFMYGGMENTSATTLYEGVLDDERAAIDYDPDPLIAHELAHQWWGDLVTCHDWVHIWLNEGFATYFQHLWTEQSLGRDDFEYEMFRDGISARDESTKQHPVVDRRGPGAGVYPKGSWVLHALRRRVGDDAFWRSIHRYVTERAYKTAETVDLRRAFEEETGESLERVFFELAERPGSPALDVTYAWREEERLLEVGVKQTQAGEPFAISCSIAVGERPDVATRVAFVMDGKDEREKRVLIPLAARPRYVRFDPDEAVLEDLTEHKGEDQWLLQLSSDPHVTGRIRAAHALADLRLPGPTAAVAAALSKDAFWGVSVECAKALARSGGDPARDALLGALAHAHPKVRRAAVEGVASFRHDEKVIRALRALLEKGDPSYAVESQALLAYAAVGGADAREWLERALAKPSHREVLRTEAIHGLEQLEDTSVLPLLERSVREHGDARVRATAASALGHVASLPTVSAEARASSVAALIEALESGPARLQGAAADALGAIGRDATAALHALDEAALHARADDVREKAVKAAERIRAGLPPDKELTRLREEMQRLREGEDKLRERLERMESRGKASDAGPW